MKYSRMVTYAGAMSALTVMHFLSTTMGYAAPFLLPKAVTNLIAVVLFFTFGLKLLHEAWTHKQEGENEEKVEAEKEIEDRVA